VHLLSQAILEMGNRHSDIGLWRKILRIRQKRLEPL